VRGKLKTPPQNEDFSYRDYLAAQHIHSYMSSAEVTILPGRGGNLISTALYEFKEKALANIYRLFPDPESSLMAGILLGVDTGLRQELQQAFKNTGTAHIIAISGFNISIIAALFVFFSRFLGAANPVGCHGLSFTRSGWRARLWYAAIMEVLRFLPSRLVGARLL
jgi:competence protein ComEC